MQPALDTLFQKTFVFEELRFTLDKAAITFGLSAISIASKRFLRDDTLSLGGGFL